MSSTRKPTEKEVADAERILAVIEMTRHNVVAKKEDADRYYGEILKKSKETKSAFVAAYTILKSYAKYGIAVPTVLTKSENHVMINPEVKVGVHGVVPHSPTSNRQPSSGREGSLESVKSVEFVTPMKLSDLVTVGPIGNGKQGVVYLKRSTVTNELFAVKEITKNVKKMDKKSQDRLAEELKHLLYPLNPCITCLHNAYFVDGIITIVEEYMDLGNLEELLSHASRRGSMPEACVAFVVTQLFQALVELQDVRKQCHRDIKPENILLNRKGEVKLADFGVASVIKTEPHETEVGNNAYMSPERINVEGYSSSCDVWAIGVIASQCYLGKFPFPTTGFVGLSNAINEPTTSIEFPATTPLDMLTFIWGCLKVAPANRTTSRDGLKSLWLLRHKETCRKAFGDWIAGYDFDPLVVETPLA